MRAAIVILIAMLASLVITACVATEPGQTQRRRLSTPDSNCRFEAYCQVIQLTDEPASAPKR